MGVSNKLVIYTKRFLKCKTLEAEVCFRNLPCERILRKHFLGLHIKYTSFAVLSGLPLQYDIVRLLIERWHFEKNSPQNVANTFFDCARQETYALRICLWFLDLTIHDNVSNS